MTVGVAGRLGWPVTCRSPLRPLLQLRAAAELRPHAAYVGPRRRALHALSTTPPTTQPAFLSFIQYRHPPIVSGPGRVSDVTAPLCRVRFFCHSLQPGAWTHPVALYHTIHTNTVTGKRTLALLSLFHLLHNQRQG